MSLAEVTEILKLLQGLLDSSEVVAIRSRFYEIKKVHTEVDLFFSLSERHCLLRWLQWVDRPVGHLSPRPKAEIFRFMTHPASKMTVDRGSNKNIWRSIGFLS